MSKDYDYRFMSEKMTFEQYRWWKGRNFYPVVTCNKCGHIMKVDTIEKEDLFRKALQICKKLQKMPCFHCKEKKGLILEMCPEKFKVKKKREITPKKMKVKLNGEQQEDLKNVNVFLERIITEIEEVSYMIEKLPRKIRGNEKIKKWKLEGIKLDLKRWKMVLNENVGKYELEIEKDTMKRVRDIEL